MPVINAKKQPNMYAVKSHISLTGKLMAASLFASATDGAAQPAKTPAMPERPNFLFIMTDHYTTLAFSYIGNKDLHTPNLDRLAREGHFFTNAYCAYPLSTPSRAAIITGMMPSENRVNENRLPLPEEFQAESLGRLLKENGYDAAWCGKWHVGKLNEDEHGFEALGDSGDTDVAGRVISFLRRGHDKPFFVAASYCNPHNICQFARNQPFPDVPTIPKVPVEECPALPANFLPSTFEPEAIRREQAANPSNYPVVGWSQDQWRHYRYAFYRLCEIVDGQIGQILDEVRRLGLEEKTVIVFTADHGDGMGAHQWNQKTVLYDEVAKIPFIVRLPGRVGAGSIHPAVVSNGIDFFPTVCDYAGIAVPGKLAGSSIRPILEGKAGKLPRAYTVTQTMFGERGHGYSTCGWMIRTDDYKYTIYDKWGNREQLFDTRADPGEMVNLAASASHRQPLDAHRRMLWEWAHRVKDRAAIESLKDLCPEFTIRKKKEAN